MKNNKIKIVINGRNNIVEHNTTLLQLINKLGIDKKKLIQIEGTRIIEGDFLEERSKNDILKFFNSKINVILSDMAPNTSGNKSLDAIKTNELCLSILEFSKKVLEEAKYWKFGSKSTKIVNFLTLLVPFVPRNASKKVLAST